MAAISVATFTTNGYLAKALTGAVNLRASHTIAIRVKWGSTVTNTDNLAVGYTSTSDQSGSYGVNRNSGVASTSTTHARWNSSGTGQQVNNAGLYGDTNTWRHFCFVYDASGTANFKVYVNGSLVSTTNSGTTTPTSSTSNTFIACRAPGKFADAALYNRALSAAEVALLAGYRTPQVTSGLVSYCRLDTNGNDSSGNNNHLSAAGSGTAVTFSTSDQPSQPENGIVSGVGSASLQLTGAATGGAVALAGAATASLQLTGAASVAASGSCALELSATASGAVTLDSAGSADLELDATASGEGGGEDDVVAGVGSQRFTGSAVSAADVDFVSDGPHTFLGWVYVESAAGADLLYGDNGGGFNNAQSVWLGFDATDFVFQVNGIEHEIRVPITLNTWKHLAFVYTGTNYQVFVDGELVDDTAMSVSGRDNFNWFDIGYGGDFTCEAVMAFEAGLTQAQIQEVMTSFKPPSGVPAYAWWKLDPGSTEDSSGNGHTLDGTGADGSTHAPREEASGPEGEGAGSLELSGAAAGAVAAAGAGAGSMQLTGAAVGAVGLAGAGATSLEGSGSAAGAVAVPGAAASSLELAAAATGAASLAGAGAAALELDATAAGRVEAASSGTGELALEGAATGAEQVAGVATSSLELAGDAAGLVDSAGAGAASLELSAAASGAVELEGVAAAELTLDGAAASDLRLEASAASELELLGSASGLVALEGAAAALLELDGDAAGAVDLEGAATAVLDLEGAGAGAGVLEGVAHLDLAGAATGAVSVEGAASVDLDLAGAADGVVALAGAASMSLEVAAEASGAVGAQAIAAAALDLSASAAGVVLVEGTGSTDLVIELVAALETELEGAAEGSLVADAAAIGVVDARGVGAGSLELTATASGQIALEGVATADLEIDATGVGQELLLTTGATSLQLTAAASGFVSLQGSASAELDLEADATIAVSTSAQLELVAAATGAVAAVGAGSASLGLSALAVGRVDLVAAASTELDLAGAAAAGDQQIAASMSLELLGAADGAVDAQAVGAATLELVALAETPERARVTQLYTANGQVPSGRYYVTQGDERLDEVAQYVYGFQSGAVEALLVLNPGLATLASARDDFVLPRGIAIVLPQLTAASSARTDSAAGGGEVQLWR